MKNSLSGLVMLMLLGGAGPGLAQNAARNGTFSTYPTPVGQTLNLPPGTNLGDWTSSVAYAGTGIYPPDTRVSVQLGGVSYFPDLSAPGGFVVRQGTFPGDPAWNVPASVTWLYSNGNNTGAAYTIWNQTVSLTPNSGYYFACYTSNAITPGRINEQDPQLELLVNGSVLGSFRVYDDADPLSGHGGLDLWDRRQIFFLSGTSTSANLSLRDSQLSTFGDDFALTAVTVTPNQPPVAQNVTTSAVPQNSLVPVGILPLVATDPDGNNTLRQPAPYTLLTVPLPAEGVLRLAGSSTNLTAGTVLTPAQISQLQFLPATGFLGNATFTYQATDEGNLVSNVATYTIPVVAVPSVDLAVSKQAYLGPYRAGGRTTFVVRVSNLGLLAATGVVARDVLPPGLALVSATPSVGSYDAGTGLWSIGGLAGGASATLSIVAGTSLISSGTTNTVTVTGSQPDAVPANNQASRTLYPGAAYADDFEGRVLPDYCAEAADLNIAIGAGIAPIGGRLSYTTSVLTNPSVTAIYRTPLLRFTGAALLTFDTKVFGPGTATNRNYTVRLVNAANALVATLRGATAYTAAETLISESLNISQVGVYKVEIQFTSATGGGGVLQAALDNVLVRGAGPAARAKDGSNCAPNLLPTPQNVTQTPTLSSQMPASPIVPLSGTDPDGNVVAFTLASVPPESQGILALGGVPVQAGQEISLAQAASLTFDPNPAFVGNATFTYFAIDDSGESSLGTAVFTLPVANTPLPVTLVRFEARPANPTDALLTWATSSEQNSAAFVVERSRTGLDFEPAGTVPAAGTSAGPHEYRYLDAGAARYGRLLYYRLRQQDRDGTTAYSPVRTVVLAGAEAGFSLQPNPGTSFLTLDLTALPAGAYAVQVLSFTGQTVASYEAAGGRTTPVDTRRLSAGAYLVRVSGPNHKPMTRRWVKLP